MKKIFVTLMMLLIAVSCNQTDLGSEFFETAADDAKCFDAAILVQDAAQMGRLSGVTYAKGLCYKESVALDANASFTTAAVIINQITSRNMFASFVSRTQDGFFVHTESGIAIKIGDLDTSFGQAAIKLSPGFKIQIAREQDSSGQLVPVLILEQHQAQQI